MATDHMVVDDCSFCTFYFFKILCNCLAVLNPHFAAMYSMVYSGLLSIVFANSLRSWVWYSNIVEPVISLKTLLRFLGLMPTIAASSSIVFSLERLSVR